MKYYLENYVLEIDNNLITISKDSKKCSIKSVYENEFDICKLGLQQNAVIIMCKVESNLGELIDKMHTLAKKDFQKEL